MYNFRMNNFKMNLKFNRFCFGYIFKFISLSLANFFDNLYKL